MPFKVKLKKKVPKMSVVAVLRKARAIVKKGWLHGKLYDGEEWVLKDGVPVELTEEDGDRELAGDYKMKSVAKVCALGAIQMAVTGDPRGVDGKVVRDACAALDAILPYADIPDFNDEEGRTKKEVLEAFDLAIENQRSGGRIAKAIAFYKKVDNNTKEEE